MRVTIQRDVARQQVDVWIQADDRVAYIADDDGTWFWGNPRKPGERVHPSLTIPEEMWEALLTEALKLPREADREAIAVHRDDAQTMRDKLFAMVESEWYGDRPRKEQP
jgi:hypothetical protein